MPAYVLAAIAGAVAVSVAAGSGGPTLLGAAAAACLLAMLAVTLLGDVSINSQSVELQAGVDPAHWLHLRRRSNTLHLLRTGLDGAVFVLAGLSVVMS